MSTITLWLLMSMAVSHHHMHGVAPATVVERFVSKDECERVSKWLQENRRGGYAPIVGCIEAKVYKP